MNSPSAKANCAGTVCELSYKTSPFEFCSNWSQIQVRLFLANRGPPKVLKDSAQLRSALVWSIDSRLFFAQHDAPTNDSSDTAVWSLRVNEISGEAEGAPCPSVGYRTNRRVERECRRQEDRNKKGQHSAPGFHFGTRPFEPSFTAASAIHPQRKH